MSKSPVSFFLIVNPGLELLALEELKVKWGRLRTLDSDLFSEEISIQEVKGGLTLQCAEGAGWLLNHYLKIPTRILQRLDHFKVRDFPGLFRKVSKFGWSGILRQGTFEVKVSATGSRLKIKERIRQTVSDGIEASGKHQPFRKSLLEVPQTIYVRMVDNEIDISIDTSGKALYLRGYKTQAVDAPLRETLASAVYWACRRQLGSDPETVIDPMCGAGTLVFESLAFWSVNRSRRFTYQNFPHAATVSSFNLKRPLGVEGVGSALGYDSNPAAIEAATANGRNFSKAYTDQFKFEVMEMEQESRPAEGAVVLINPPYNERIKADQKQVAENIESYLDRHRPRLAGILWPGELPALLSNRAVAQFSTNNGGIPVTIGILSPSIKIQ